MLFRRILAFLRELWHADRKAAFLLLTNRSFRCFRRLGVYVLPAHFYSPVPDERELQESGWSADRASRLSGVDLRDDVQRRCLRELFPTYAAEFDFPRQPTGSDQDYHTANIFLGFVSAAAMHSFVRARQPRRIVEVGLGYSTRVLARAARMNAEAGRPVELVGIDPYPAPELQAGLPGLTRLIVERVQRVDNEVFGRLEAGDILSIDTSHVVRTAGDVTHLYLEVLPSLRPGVLVHVHDIFLPFDYPAAWLRSRRFWNEQYLLQALLVHSRGFAVVWGQRYCEHRYPEDYARAFLGRVDPTENFASYSFWLERVG